MLSDPTSPDLRRTSTIDRSRFAPFHAGNVAVRSAVTALLGVLAVVLSQLPTPAYAVGGSISGVAFEDVDGNGQLDPGEPTFAGHELYLYDEAGRNIARRTTDADGRYSFTGLAEGRYQVRYAPLSWWSIRDELVPTTTGSVWPRRDVDVAGGVASDFGWRPIVRSTDLGSPISAFTGPEGLRVQSFNDAVSAREIYDHVVQGTVGDEAPSVIVRFGYGTSDSASIAVQRRDGSYTSFSAVAYVSYLSWLDTYDRILSHEYGHAWTLYHAYMVQQDNTFAGYLDARGLTGDDRLNSSYQWSVTELMAEDYRQLLGSPTARLAPQVNRHIPPAAEVDGLEDYLRGPFTQAPEEGSAPAPTAPPAPTDDETSAPSDDEAAAAPPIELQVTETKVRGRTIADLSWTGTSGQSVQVLRDGTLIAVVADAGRYQDETKHGGAVYVVCDAGTERCSEAGEPGEPSAQDGSGERKGGGPKDR